MNKYVYAVVCASLLSAGCGAFEGEPGPAGSPGADGKDGTPGAMGSQGVAGKDSTVSGSRIRAVYHVAEDGARTMIGWHDSELNTPCRFGPTEDGKTRCFPSSNNNKSLSSLYYVSPSCDDSSMVTDTHPTCANPAYLLGSISEACSGTRISVYKTGDMVAPDVMYKKSGGSCIPNVGPVPNLQRVTHIDPSALVEAVESIE